MSVSRFVSTKSGKEEEGGKTAESTSLLYGNAAALLLITGAYSKSLLVPLFCLAELKGHHRQGEIDLSGKAALFLFYFFSFKVFIPACLCFLTRLPV